MEWIEEKYLDNSYHRSKVTIPIIRATVYGNPLFCVELLTRIRKKQRYIYQINIGVPHLEKTGYKSWRKIKCDMPSIALGDSIKTQGSWFLTSFCKEHNAPIIEIYAPREAKQFVISNLFTSVNGSIEWEV